MNFSEPYIPLQRQKCNSNEDRVNEIPWGIWDGHTVSDFNNSIVHVDVVLSCILLSKHSNRVDVYVEQILSLLSAIRPRNWENCLLFDYLILLTNNTLPSQFKTLFVLFLYSVKQNWFKFAGLLQRAFFLFVVLIYFVNVW